MHSMMVKLMTHCLGITSPRWSKSKYDCQWDMHHRRVFCNCVYYFYYYHCEATLTKLSWKTANKTL